MQLVSSETGSRPQQDWFLTGQIHDNEPPRRFPLHSFPFSIGRRSDSTLCLPLGCVSKNHAEIRLGDQGQLILAELGSTNGTFVNGEPLATEIEIKDNDLIHIASLVFRVGCSRANVPSKNTIQADVCDQALAMVQLERLISDGGLNTYFQPIVKLEDRAAIGYEVLGRSKLYGLQSPNEMFIAASQLNLESQLSEKLRVLGVERGQLLGADTNMFVNTHPKELDRPEFYDSLKNLREMAPNQLITIEIHEAAATNMAMMREMCAVLSDLQMKLAFDDFGVGKARLVELGEVRPDYLKFDMKLTMNIESAPPKRQELVALFANLVNSLGIQTLAEGVETEECHTILSQMGFKLGQGFLYGKPASISHFLPTPEGTGRN